MAIITISRQFGAGGRTLGGIIAKEMGYVFFDNEIIQRVAKKAKVSANWVESVEKEAGGKFQRFISGLVPKSLVDRILDDKRGYIDEEIYVDMLHEIITRIADEGNAVIIGRGSQYILKDRKDTIHIFLIANKEDRVKFMELHYDLSPTRALQAVDADDKRRINLYRKFGKTDYEQPILYHMTLNTTLLDMESARDTVCQAARGKERILADAAGSSG